MSILDLPQLDGLVVRPAEEGGGGHSAYTPHRMKIPLEGLEVIARGDVPQLDGLVLRADEEGGVRYLAYTMYLIRMVSESSRSRFPRPIP